MNAQMNVRSDESDFVYLHLCPVKQLLIVMYHI
jgi:hypothetical protein